MSNPAVIKSSKRLPVLATDKRVSYPVLGLQTGVLFPGHVMALQVRRPDSLQLVEDVIKPGKEFVATYSPLDEAAAGESPIHQVGTYAIVKDRREGEGHSWTVTIEGLRRAVLDQVVERDPYLVMTALELQPVRAIPRVLKGQVEAAISMVGEITQLDPTYSLEFLHVLKMCRKNPSYLADLVAATFHFPIDSKQSLLEAVGLKARFERLIGCLGQELHRLTLLPVVDDSLPRDVDRRNGSREKSPSSTIMTGAPARIQRLIEGARHLPAQVIARATVETDRLAHLPEASSEYGATKLYLEQLLKLPWNKTTPENYEIADVKKVLDADYYGPKLIKEQILQRLSVAKLQGGLFDGPTLCLVGAPGTGKASLAKAIARALGKEFLRISVGGISRSSEIKGSPRALLGAMPGKIIRTMANAASCDPVILIEDIDYFNIQNEASTNAALLEVVDSRHNGSFLDEYLAIPFDLSKVLFICSVRSYEEIPEQFLPRFETLELPGYSEREKITIARKHIFPEMLRKHGLAKSDCKISDKTLSKMLASYTQEAGLLGCSQQIARICRKIALEKAEKKRTSWTINEKNLTSYLGPTLFIPEKAESLPEIGTAAGLAWTGAGGDLMFIEGLKMKGEGQITTTGSLGEVMKESIQAAHSYVRSKADLLGIDSDDFKEFDIHIHFPSGAIPKDGPSAGVTVCLVIASVMSERPIRNDVAMTGELTLRGKVLPVGGVKEKISAAYRCGIYQIAVPKENEKDLRELPPEILRKCKFTYLERVDDLFELCLMNFTPSAFTLEKVFAEEIEKAKKKARRSRPAKPKAKAKPKPKPKAARKHKK
jgi:ATP-dependent Lon protease